MPWTYTQSTGELANPDSLIIGIGYSGRFEGLNNPAMQAEHNTGPIPQGKWEIGKFFNDQRPHGKGPMVCPLIPFPETETFGRTEFMIHGDNKGRQSHRIRGLHHPGTLPAGCNRSQHGSHT
jgi:hypothetical protein